MKIILWWTYITCCFKNSEIFEKTGKYFGKVYFKNKSFSKKLYNRIHVGIYDAKKPHSFKYSAIKPGGLKKLHYPIFYKFWTHVVLGENY